MLDSYYYQFKTIKDAYFYHIKQLNKSNLHLVVVLGAFCAELGLKTIHEYRNRTKGKYGKIIESDNSSWKTHSIKKLFNLQDGKDKSNLISKFNKEYTPKEFSELLKVISNNFVEWRYYLNHDSLKTNLFLMSDLLNAIDLTIQDIDW